MNVMRIYDRLPVFMQNCAVSLEGLRIQLTRYGNVYEKAYREFMERNDWSYQRKCEYRDEMLRRIVKHCYETVPYYHRVFDEWSIDYRQIQTLDDLKILPMIDKQTVKEHYDDFFSTAFRRKDLIRQHTSGSTGAGFVFYMSKEAYAAEWAHVWRGNHNIGLERGTWCGYFGGRTIVPKDQAESPFFRINWPGKQILFSTHHMRPDVLSEYVMCLNKYRPEWIHGYPSAMTALANHMLDHDERLTYSPEIVTLGSENVHEYQSALIEKAFGVYPLQNYAQTEAVATFRQRSDGKIFVDEDFSAVEFVPVEDHSSYKVIGTTLTNYAMPFLRYDTKDLAVYMETVSGRQVLHIDGRQEDAIQVKDGSVLGRLSPVFKDQTFVAGAQIVQKSMESLLIKVVKAQGYSDGDEARLRAALDGYLKGKIGYCIEYVDSIEKAPNGKQRFVISEL